MNLKGLMTTPIYRALNRGNLFMGGDRELVMLSLLALFTLLVTLDWIAILFGVLMSLFSIYLLRKMAKSDPDMRKVFLRHRQYQDYYPAMSTPFRIDQK